MKRNVITQYNLPGEVRFCKKCTISNQRPRITFDAHGVCSACNFSDRKKTSIDWIKREQELAALCNRFRKSTGEFDVIVPGSGGKDGSYVAHQLKHQYGMTPLTVTWSPLRYTEIGRKNLDAFIAHGFDNILGTPNGETTRKLTSLAFQHLGEPFQPFAYGQINLPLHVAVKYGVPLIFLARTAKLSTAGT